jgi:putative sporulation protein YyaC
MQKEKKILYFNTNDRYASIEFGDSLYQLLIKDLGERPLIFLCIGSDRATGDCLGPLLGHKLYQILRNSPYFVYGTLKEPVHAKNLQETIDKIYQLHENPLIIAIDASLGRSSHVGYYTLGEGPLRPGAGVDKQLPFVGDYYITGIVNISGLLDQMLLQTTRLHTVMSLSDQIFDGIRHFIYKLDRKKVLLGSYVP